MRDPGLEAQPVVHGAVAQERKVEGLPIVGDEKIVLAQNPLHLRDQGTLLGVVAGEELPQDEIPLPDMTEPDEKDRLRLKPARLDIEEQHTAMPELPEESSLGRIQRLDRFRERVGHGSLLGARQPPDLLVLLEQRGRALVQLRVEPLVNEDGSLPTDQHAPRKDVLDRSGYDPLLARTAHGGVKRRASATSCSLAAEHLPDPLPKRGGDHRPSIRRSSATVAALLGIGQPP